VSRTWDRLICGVSAMYVRFVVSVRTGRGHERRGLFRIIDRLEDCPRLEAERRRRVDALLAWFNKHLPVPGDDAFNVEDSRCWYKPDAADCIERSRELLALYRAAGWRALEIWNRDPGIVTYEDEAQVVVRPRHEAGTAAY
jgi:hypothetical protein